MPLNLLLRAEVGALGARRFKNKKKGEERAGRKSAANASVACARVLIEQNIWRYLRHIFQPVGMLIPALMGT